MADGLTREERVAAGLRKLKQFQQRSGRKSQSSRKKSPETSVSTSKENLLTKLDKQETNLSQDLKEQSKKIETESSNHSNLSSFSSEHNVSGSESNLALKVNEQESPLKAKEEILGKVSKSKSDVDISSIKELSSTESLLQISQQINGLMSETHAVLNGTIEQEESNNCETNVLERRNQELASIVNNLQQSNDYLQFQFQELKSKNSRLQKEFETERQELLEKAHKEQVALKDQLQVHIQTIGILVAEKTELQSSLSLSQQTAKQKAAEVEELQGRLRASRQRAADLERDLNSLNSSNQQFEKGSKETSKELDRLKTDNYKLSKNVEELKQQCSELSEKLSKKISDNTKLEDEVADVRNKLSLSELYLQQLNQGINSNNPSQVEDLHNETLELKKQISQYKESIDKLINERDQMSDQYQLYIQQLSQQVTSLRDEFKQVNEEKELLSKEKNSLMEKLENLKHSQESLPPENIAELKLQLTVLENKNAELNKELETQISDNAQMSRLIQEQETKLSELESKMQRLQEQEVDKARLLETMQSDKVAASRAVAQNRELKKQLEELHDGFVIMSNDKLQLTEKLHGEQHITKELGERLSQQEEELRELKDQLTQKEEELEKLHKTATKGMYQQDQIADRMRHYEAQGQLTDMLQQELTQAKERINTLVNQNTELRMHLARKVETSVSSENSKEDAEASKRSDLVASLSTSVRQLEMERDQLMKQLDEQNLLRTKLDSEIKKREGEINEGDKGDGITREEFEKMKTAMEQLEEKFKQTMDEIAGLSDEKQQLEHLVLQLQGETETIGDYIALYQIQRSLMRKRASEKDDYIAQLAKDREDLKAKLAELQNLVIRLLAERRQLHSGGAAISSYGIDSLLQGNKMLNGSNTADADPNEKSIEVGIAVTEEPASINSENTAKQIMDLLTDIESNNLIEKPVTDNFHPCPVCSGRLITV